MWPVTGMLTLRDPALGPRWERARISFTTTVSRGQIQNSSLPTILEKGVEEGSLLGTETWIFFDNSTSESAFWKGHSASPLLNDLALCLRKLDMGGRVRIHMVHIP
jgi:hypothetical protein